MANSIFKWCKAKFMNGYKNINVNRDDCPLSDRNSGGLLRAGMFEARSDTETLVHVSDDDEALISEANSAPAAFSLEYPSDQVDGNINHRFSFSTSSGTDQRDVLSPSSSTTSHHHNHLHHHHQGMPPLQHMPVMPTQHGISPHIPGSPCVEEVTCDVRVDGASTDRREFSFTLYDFDGQGRVTKDDMCGLVRRISEAVGSSLSLPTGGSRSVRVRVTVAPPRQRGLQRQELLQIIRDNMEKNHLYYSPGGGRCCCGGHGPHHHRRKKKKRRTRDLNFTQPLPPSNTPDCSKSTLTSPRQVEDGCLGSLDSSPRPLEDVTSSLRTYSNDDTNLDSSKFCSNLDPNVIIVNDIPEGEETIQDSRYSRDSNAPVNIRHHRQKVDHHARAMAQVVTWLENGKLLNNDDDTYDSNKNRDEDSRDITPNDWGINRDTPFLENGPPITDDGLYINPDVLLTPNQIYNPDDKTDLNCSYVHHSPRSKNSHLSTPSKRTHKNNSMDIARWKDSIPDSPDQTSPALVGYTQNCDDNDSASSPYGHTHHVHYHHHYHHYPPTVPNLT